MSETYYGARVRQDGEYEGVVYTWDDSGNHQQWLFVSDPIVSREDAVDIAVEWADENGYNAQME